MPERMSDENISETLRSHAKWLTNNRDKVGAAYVNVAADCIDRLRAELAARGAGAVGEPVAWVCREADGYQGPAPRSVLFIHEKPRRWKPEDSAEQWVSSRGNDATFDDREAELLGCAPGQCVPLYAGPPLTPKPLLPAPVWHDAGCNSVAEVIQWIGGAGDKLTWSLGVWPSEITGRTWAWSVNCGDGFDAERDWGDCGALTRVDAKTACESRLRELVQGATP